MPSGPDGEAGDALLGALVTILSIFVAALLAFSILPLQLRRIHRQYKELLRQSTVTPTLSQRIREQRKSAISHIIAEEDLEQQREQIISSPIPQRSGYSTNSSRCGRIEVFANDITCIEPSSPEAERWAIRKVRSMERLTGLTNELSAKPERRNPFHEPASGIQDRNPFYDREGDVECDPRCSSKLTQDAKAGDEAEALKSASASLETVNTEPLD
ncbi:uncharacterized protein DFL_009044 [Arthrobotrys flagrans]|uniref:Uncharacterized protein n=1 Tax=Arthrobotrys flagrans TaxID=97331 RepID=A0A436ZQJ2_ARTFL|nr:hypothetical protein DFL_009044 [Arthrobotrys flagrans]